MVVVVVPPRKQTGMDFKQALREWRESNPLREWRKREDLTLADAAVMLAVSQSTIQAWESGAATPNVNALQAALLALGYGSAARLELDWRAWQARKPELVAAGG